MSEEDLNQIRQIVVQIVAESEARITAKQDRAVEAIGVEFSRLRSEMNRRFEAVEGHLERMDTRLATNAIELAGIHKALDRSDREERQILTTQAAQQKAIDDLYAQLAEIKRRLDQPRQ